MHNKTSSSFYPSLNLNRIKNYINLLVEKIDNSIHCRMLETSSCRGVRESMEYSEVGITNLMTKAHWERVRCGLDQCYTIIKYESLRGVNWYSHITIFSSIHYTSFVFSTSGHSSTVKKTFLQSEKYLSRSLTQVGQLITSFDGFFMLLLWDHS